MSNTRLKKTVSSWMASFPAAFPACIFASLVELAFGAFTRHASGCANARTGAFRVHPLSSCSTRLAPDARAPLRDMMLVHSCCSARLSAPFPLSRSVHRSRHKQLAGRSPPRANAAEQEETALARESGLQAKLYPEGRGSPGLTSSDELRALLKNRPAYKQWVQRWWTASAPVAIELLLSLPEADVNVTDDRGETKLLQAARLAQLDIVKVNRCPPSPCQYQSFLLSDVRSA